jgi:hypothetical protein
VSDYDDRFRDLVRQEFGTEVPGEAPPEPEPARAPYRPADFFSLDRALAEADGTPDPWDAFSPPEEPRFGRPPVMVLVGAVLVAGAVVLGFLGAFVVRLPKWAGIGGGIAFGVGLAVLLLSIPRRREKEYSTWPYDDGAVV